MQSEGLILAYAFLTTHSATFHIDFEFIHAADGAISLTFHHDMRCVLPSILHLLAHQLVIHVLRVFNLLKLLLLSQSICSLLSADLSEAIHDYIVLLRLIERV